MLVPHGQEIFGTLDMALGHYRRYSHEELKGKMEQAGFRVETILDFNRISRPGWYVTGKLLKRTTLSALQMKVFDRLVWLWRRVDQQPALAADFDYRDRGEGVALADRLFSSVCTISSSAAVSIEPL